MAPRSPPDEAEYRFRIDVYTPETMPMARLSLYMAALASMLGEPAAVHFRRLAKGSTVLVSKVEREAHPKVRARVNGIRTGTAPPDAIAAYRDTNKLLREDNGVATLREQGVSATIVKFPGREERQEIYPTIRKQGSIDGVLTQVGGADKTAHARLLVDGRVLTGFQMSRPLGKELAHRLYEPVRLFGRGDWTRGDDGLWELKLFRIESFAPLDGRGLKEGLAALRAIKSDWGDDPYEAMNALRHGPEREADGGSS